MSETSKNTNALQVIHPYREHGTWMFDDEKTGLVREPFVAGIDTLMDEHAAALGGTDQLTLIFSQQPFPGASVHLQWLREEAGGNWYRDLESGREGWLCPALLRYFPKAPADLHVQVKRR
ncbi:MAG: DUF6717 family protein [Armatimonadota bacterium]